MPTDKKKSFDNKKQYIVTDGHKNYNQNHKANKVGTSEQEITKGLKKSFLFVGFEIKLQTRIMIFAYSNIISRVTKSKHIISKLANSTVASSIPATKTQIC